MQFAVYKFMYVLKHEMEVVVVLESMVSTHTIVGTCRLALDKSKMCTRVGLDSSSSRK